MKQDTFGDRVKCYKCGESVFEENVEFVEVETKRTFSERQTKEKPVCDDCKMKNQLLRGQKSAPGIGSGGEHGPIPDELEERIQ